VAPPEGGEASNAFNDCNTARFRHTVSCPASVRQNSPVNIRVIRFSAFAN